MTCTHCDELARARGLCDMHYKRWRRGQDLTTPRRTGGRVAYNQVHRRVKTIWGAATQYPCVTCGGPARHWAYDGTDPDQGDDPRGPYSSWPEFYMPLCARCHSIHDWEVRLGPPESRSCVECGRTPRGSKGADGLCSRCYQRARRMVSVD